MRRRDFITILWGAAVTWPLAARAQQQKTWRVGYLSSGPADLGYIEGMREQLKAGTTGCPALQKIL
jgi:putative ABC transport system substrate-binding protein